MSTEAARPDEQNEPTVGGLKVRPPLAVGLYALLVVSFAAALWAQRTPGDASEAVARLAPWLFLVFACGLALYRFALVAARRYSPFKAFFQVVVAFVLFFLLLRAGNPPVVAGPVAAPSDLAGLLADPDPRIRALSAELARYRPTGPEVARALVRCLEDPDPSVREVAHGTLVQFNSGVDLGLDPASWRARFP